ncbi:MAG: phosphoribosylanthranilate isomerase [Puniceicoccales bacterium]|jgi:phosphoribosylanthranilate isomerase|nr:phosphoribosylanthranilate isomerase [Puniceicoccales bacterium]
MDFTVKVCGITRRVDVTGALAQGVDFLGVNRWPESKRFVPDDLLPALLAEIPRGRRVFVDVSPTREKLDAAVADGFDFFQIHFDASVGMARTDVTGWHDTVGRERLWLAPRVGPGAVWPLWCLPYADVFLCDGFHAGEFGGTGRAADWGQFRELKNKHTAKRWLLAGGLGAETIGQAVRQSDTDFVDLNSGVESAPGIKDMTKLATTLALLREIGQGG